MFDAKKITAARLRKKEAAAELGEGESDAEQSAEGDIGEFKEAKPKKGDEAAFGKLPHPHGKLPLPRPPMHKQAMPIIAITIGHPPPHSNPFANK